MGLDWRDDVAMINEARNQLEQRLIEGLEKPIKFVYGFGDTASFGISRYIRQGQGLDDSSLDCSTAYNIGGWSAVGVEVVGGGYGIYKAAGKFALKRSLKKADEFVDLYHGSYRNADDIYKNGLTVNKKGATNVSTDIDAATDAIDAHLRLEPPPFNTGIIKSKVPKSKLDDLTNGVDIKYNDNYQGFHPYKLNTSEHLLNTPRAKDLFNSGIIEFIPYP